jgi:hypothetical protein
LCFSFPIQHYTKTKIKHNRKKEKKKKRKKERKYINLGFPSFPVSDPAQADLTIKLKITSTKS